MQYTLTERPELAAGLCLGAFAASMFVTPLARRLALRLGWLDHPDFDRKVHAFPVPRTGGIAVLAGWLAALAMAAGAGVVDPDSADRLWKLLPAVAAIFATGLLDDVIGLTPRQKLSGQAAAAALACAAGLSFRSLAGIELPAPAGTALTWFWLMACANCFNLIDGVDGLAAGVGSISALAIAVVALDRSLPLPLLVTVPLAGALLGFLRHNFSPASIFLGDSGSLLSGFLLGCCLVWWPHPESVTLSTVAPLFILAIPFLDTGLSVIRRFLAGRPICHGDQGHLHHRLLATGLSARGVSITLYVGAALAGTAAVVQASNASYAAFAATALFCLITTAAAAHLYRAELHTILELPRDTALRARARARVALRHHEARLRNAVTPEQCWGALVDLTTGCGLTRAALRLGDRQFDSGRTAAESWWLQLPLHPAGLVAVGGPGPPSVPIEILSAALLRLLNPKAAEFQTAASAVEPAPGKECELEIFTAGVTASGDVEAVPVPLPSGS